MDISELEKGAMLLSAYSDGGRGERVGSDKKQLVRSVPAEERQSHNKVERHFFFFFLLEDSPYGNGFALNTPRSLVTHCWHSH